MKRAVDFPFTWIDGVILGVCRIPIVYVVLVADSGFLELLNVEASQEAPWSKLPAWVRELELPAKRIHCDFIAFLSVMSLGIAMVTFHHRGSGRACGLPEPGVAATACAAFFVVLRTFERLFLLWGRHLPLVRSNLIWPRVLCSLSSTLDWGFGLIWFEIESGVIGAILGVWTYLVLARAWKARASWTDWLGRWLGWCWLSGLAFHVLVAGLWG